MEKDDYIKHIEKHFGCNTPKWIVDNCRAMLIDWDNLKKQPNGERICLICRKVIIGDKYSEFCSYECWDSEF